MRSAVAIVFLLLLAGCAGAGLFEDPNTLYVNYVCNPEGATLYSNNATVGTCPAKLNYKITDQDRARGYMMLSGVTATWVSGASISTTNPVRASLQNGLQQHFNFERPRNVAGYDTDANYALNLQRNRMLAAQAQAQQEAEGLDKLNNAIAAANAGLHSTPPPPPPPPTLPPQVHCTTMALGGGISTTNCN